MHYPSVLSPAFHHRYDSWSHLLRAAQMPCHRYWSLLLENAQHQGFAALLSEANTAGIATART